LAYVNVPNDLSKIKTKIAFNLTKRQLICFGLAAVIGIPTYLFMRSAIGNMLAIIRHIFESMRSIPKSEVVNSGLAALKQEHESRYKAAQREYTKAAVDLAELKAEVLKAIRGQSKFTPELLNELITESEKSLVEIEVVRNTAKQELDGCKYQMEEMQAKYDEVISWTELYDAADLAAKKMIVANLINRVEVGTDYDIHIDFNIDLEHFNIKLDIAA